MFKWLRKNSDAHAELLFQIREINQKLQQVIDENKRLQTNVDSLKEQVKQKDIQLIEIRRKYKVYNGLLLSDEQSSVVDLLEYTNDCYFITGKAGTGKSTILKYFVENTRKKVIALAPTGLAANIIEGRTIHSFFGLAPIFQDIKDHQAVNSGINADPKLIEELDTIIIDEVSMVRADVMDMMDKKLRAAKKKFGIPFGGVQMILFGDLLQLAPVVTGADGPILQNRYQTSFFFGAPSAKKGFVVCSLMKIHRQTDTAFINLLNKIRVDTVKQSELDDLYKYCGGKNINSKNNMYIVPTNSQATEINDEQLRLLSTPEYTYYASKEGDATEEDTPTTEKITLKVGATVMMLCNDTNKCYVNGTLAKVVELTDDMIKVHIPCVGITSIDRYTWNKYKYVYNPEEDKIETQLTGSFTQYPLKLAYAITVHKSQGQTFDHATIDYEKTGAFAPGQTYVALSRCRRLEDIHLSVPLHVKDIIVSHEAIDYLKHNIVPLLPYAKQHLSSYRIK